MGFPSPFNSPRTRTHKQSSSADFGDFHSAPMDPSPTSVMATNVHHPAAAPDLDSGDLLMSFDEIDEDGSRTSSTAPGLQPNTDLLSDEPDFSPSSKRSVESSPTRMRHGPLRGRRSFSTFTGPSSPPRVSEAGADIIFHPPYGIGHDNTAANSLRRMSSQGPGLEFERSSPSEPHVPGEGQGGARASPSSESSHHTSPRPRSLVDAFATSKIATRWKRSVLGPNLQQVTGEPEPPSKTAVPIDVSHTSPFASRDQIAGSYIAPEGAPGFRPQDGGSRWDEDSEWANTKLEGRRESTTPVLSQAQAQAVRTDMSLYLTSKLRPHLPARQRIYDTWHLLCL